MQWGSSGLLPFLDIGVFGIGNDAKNSILTKLSIAQWNILCKLVAPAKISVFN